MCHNPNLDLASVETYAKFGQNLCIFLKILSGNEIDVNPGQGP